MDEKVLIPFPKLAEGIERCLKQAEMLVDSSSLLYKAKKYPACIALSILGTEETAKIKMLLERRDKSRDVTEKDWLEMTRGSAAHKVKLAYSHVESASKLERDVSFEQYRMIVRSMSEMGLDISRTATYQKAKTVDSEEVRKLELLDKIKLDSLYVEWKGSEWYSILTSLSKTRQKSLAFLELKRAEFFYWQCVRWARYPLMPLPNTAEFELFKKETFNQKILEISRLGAFKSQAKRARIYKTIIDEYGSQLDKSRMPPF